MNTENEAIKKRVKDYIINLVNKGELEEAKKLISDYRQKVKDDIEIFSILSVIYVYEGSFNESEKILREGLKQECNNYDLMYNLAYLYESTELKCIPLALSYYKRCLNVVENEDLKISILETIDRLKMKLTTFKEGEKPLVSIVVLAYNHSEYTKSCIESIYKYTANINYELITVNNGSTDDTEEYFNSLPNKKKINIVNNVRPVDGFNTGMESAEGKYTACVCNDFIFTENWLDNLLKCIESDDTIGFVSPGANKISNNQQIDCNFDTLEEMQEFAKNYNISNPNKWEERVRLLPCVLLCRTELLKDLGGYDPRFYYGEYGDDDFSFRLRRLGYKLVYAADTITFHAGSVTTKEDHIENNSMSVSAKIFFDKHNIDPHIEALFNPIIVNKVNYRNKPSISILGINTFCGGTPLQIKNQFRSKGFNSVKITSFTENTKYMEDLRTVSDEVYYINSNKLSDYMGGRKFDIIVFENGIENASDIYYVIKTLKESLIEGGQLIFALYNAVYYLNLFNFDSYERSLYSDGTKISYLDFNKLIEILTSNDFNKITGNSNLIMIKQDLINDIVKNVSAENQAEFKNTIAASKFIISCEI
jgi:Predicted glycosyltransferases